VPLAIRPRLRTSGAAGSFEHRGTSERS